MSKSISRLQRLVVMVISVIIFASITTYPASPAYAQSRIERAKAKLAEAKKKYEDGKEALKEKIDDAKEKIEAGKMAIIQTKNEALKFKAHWDKFSDGFGPRDFIGRSFPHFAYIVVMWNGILLILYRKEDYDRSALGFIWRFAVAFLPAVFLGFYYELLRTSNINELMQALDAAPDVPGVTKVVTGWNRFWWWAQYLLPIAAGFVWIAGMFSQRRWIHKFGDVLVAHRMKELKYFLLHRVLPPHILQLAPATGTTAPSGPTAQVAQPATQAVPAQPVGSPQTAQPAAASPSSAEQPAAAPFVRPKTTVTRYCPSCKADVEVKPNGNFCADCGSELKKEVAAPTVAASPAGPAIRNQAPPSLYEIWWRPS